MESLLAPLVIGTGVFFAIRFHQQDKGWGWGLLYGLFLWPIALVHVLVIAMTAFFNGGGFARFARDAGSYAKSGAEHMRNGRYNEAIKDFGRAIELDPHPYVYEARGETYALQSKYDKAIPDFNRAIEIIDTQGFFPLQDAPYYQRGIAWAEFNEYHKAIEDFNRAIVLNPTSECYLFRGHIYAELENYDKALKDYEEAVSLNPNADTYKYRGIAYLKIGEHEKALNDFRIATSLNQEDPQAHLNAAQAYFEKNDLKSANEAFTQSMSLLPDYLRANSDFFKQEEQSEIYDLALELDEIYGGNEGNLSSNAEIASKSTPRTASENKMTSELQQIVLDILTDNLRSGSSEAEAPNKRHLPTQAVSNATPESLRAFIDIHEAISAIVTSDYYRTRHAGRTSTEGIGLAYYNRPMGDGRRVKGIEIQAVLLPTKVNREGCVEAYLSGHVESPITAPTFHNQSEENKTRDGRPVFRIIGRPSRQLTQQIINSYSRSSLFSQIQSE